MFRHLAFSLRIAYVTSAVASEAVSPFDSIDFDLTFWPLEEARGTT